MKKRNDYQNKSAVITGAASGLGNGIAQKMLDLGANVVLLDIDEERLNGFVETNNHDNERILTLKCDVTDSDAVKTCFDAASGRFNTVDCLFNK